MLRHDSLLQQHLRFFCLKIILLFGSVYSQQQKAIKQKMQSKRVLRNKLRGHDLDQRDNKQEKT